MVRRCASTTFRVRLFTTTTLALGFSVVGASISTSVSRTGRGDEERPLTDMVSNVEGECLLEQSSLIGSSKRQAYTVSQWEHEGVTKYLICDSHITTSAVL